ncbi:hypothetical protein [Paenibacillus sp. SI8]|uniref:hypothetical protein n=1 Tax=unclassified Paenibacillus TaxID=185978 RepID=UPI0034660C4B
MSESSIAAHPRGKKVSFIVNIVIHSLYILTLPVWYFISMFSAMLFDAPGSELHLPIWIFYYALQSYPYIVIGAIAAAWIMYKKSLYGWTYPINVFPFVCIGVSTGIMAIFGE